MDAGLLIEIDKEFNPIYGCMNETTIRQFINVFFINDHNLEFLNTNKDDINDIILNSNYLTDNIHFLFGDNDANELIIQNLPKEYIHKIFSVFEIDENEIVRNLQDRPVYDDEFYPFENDFQQIQVGTGISSVIIIIILAIIGAILMKIFGSNKILGKLPYGDKIESFHELIKNDKLCILIINLGKQYQQKILKINVNPNYYTMYLSELDMYNKLRANSKANVAEFTDAKIITTNHNHDAIISFDNKNFTFKLTDLADISAIEKSWKSEYKNKMPIRFVYLSGNYYENIIDFWELITKYKATSSNINFCVFDILRNIETAYNDIGFIHGDLKIDNVLVDTSSNYKKVNKTLIFDLDFSYCFGKPNITSIYLNVDYDYMINSYLQAPEFSSTGNQNRFTRDFLHFFDLYFFSISLQSKITASNLSNLLIEIRDLCSNQSSTIPNSFKYFHIISLLIKSYDISKKSYDNKYLQYNSIILNYNKFINSAAYKTLAPFEIQIFDNIQIIFDEQSVNIN